MNIKNFLLLFVTTSAHQFKLCDNNNMGITNINLNPDTPAINSDLSVELKGFTDKAIQSLTILLEISVLNIPIDHVNIDICKTGQCPIKNNYTLNFKYHIPDTNIHSFDADVKLIIRDGSEQISCLDVNTHITENRLSGINLISKIEALFKYWQNYYNKQYTTSEYKKRFVIFINNTKYILENKYKFSLGHNHMSDWTHEEYKSLLGYKKKKSLNKLSSYTRKSFNTYISNSVDWRLHNAVTPVKNQGKCGSCWSFSTTGALEGAYAIKTGKLVSFSEQELVSCDKVDQGCNGGLMDNAFDWIQNNNGLCSENNYPYKSIDGFKFTCAANCNNVIHSKIKSYVDVEPKTNSLEIALNKQPVSIAIEADHPSFQFYKSGVYKANCGNKLDHGVLAVGYGTLGDTDYWIVKNSWGTFWGDSGFILIEKGSDISGGECGILLSASYPVL